ncbi:MAG: hypothetical protein ACOCWF_09020, partial [Halochromatium sp.]
IMTGLLRLERLLMGTLGRLLLLARLIALGAQRLDQRLALFRQHVDPFTRLISGGGACHCRRALLIGRFDLLLHRRPLLGQPGKGHFLQRETPRRKPWNVSRT